MKAKLVFLVVAGLFLATASQAQFHDSYKDSRELNRARHEMTYDRDNVARSHKPGRRRHHHHHHGHRHGHRFS